jgi:hypothetical protein
MEEPEVYVPILAVAAVDLLGISKLVEKTEQSTSAMNAIAKFARNASARDIYVDPTFVTKHQEMYAIDDYFGDAVYLFGDPNLDLDEQIRLLVIRVATLILLGLCGENRFLVRASIATGDLRRKSLRTERGVREIRIGSSMVKALHLQEDQNWIGGAVDASAPINEETRKWLLEYPVPLKRAVTQQPPLAVNWVASSISRQQVEDALRNTVAEIGSSAEAEIKLRNTLDFIRLVHDVQRYPPFGMEEA